MTEPRPLAIRDRPGRPFTRRPVLPRLSPAGDRIAWLITDGDPRVGIAGAWYARVDRVDPVRVLENLEITDLAWSRTDRGSLIAGWDPETAEGSLWTVLPAATPRLMANVGGIIEQIADSADASGACPRGSGESGTAGSDSERSQWPLLDVSCSW